MHTDVLYPTHVLLFSRTAELEALSFDDPVSCSYLVKALTWRLRYPCIMVDNANMGRTLTYLVAICYHRLTRSDLWGYFQPGVTVSGCFCSASSPAVTQFAPHAHATLFNRVLDTTISLLILRDNILVLLIDVASRV